MLYLNAYLSEYHSNGISALVYYIGKSCLEVSLDLTYKEWEGSSSGNDSTKECVTPIIKEITYEEFEMIRKTDRLIEVDISSLKERLILYCINYIRLNRLKSLEL